MNAVKDLAVRYSHRLDENRVVASVGSKGDSVDNGLCGSIIVRTLRMLFDLSRIGRLEQEMEQLFGLRDDAAHPWVAVRPPQPHPYGFTNTSVEVATYTPEVAPQSIDPACALLDQCSLHPVETNRSAKRWARDNREGG